jgi:hypothetical protein
MNENEKRISIRNFELPNVLFQTKHISSFRAQLQGVIIPKASTSWENDFLGGNGWSSDCNLCSTHVNSMMTGRGKIENYLTCPSTALSRPESS